MLGMEATLSNAGKMRSVIASDTLSTLPLPPKSLPSTSLMSQVALKPGETSSTGSKAGERALKSLWIRRLNPWDEAENANGNAVDFASEIEECGGLCSEKVDPESSLQPVGGHLQERTFMKPRVEKQSTKNKDLDRDQTVLNMRTEASPDTRQQIVQKDSGVDRQRNGFRLGKESSNLMAVPFSIGFGPWINLSAGTRLGGKPQMGNAFEPVVAFQTCKQAGESTTQKSNNGKAQVEASTMVSSIGKPPLPPAQSKLGLPLRPVGLKTQGPSLLLAGRVTSSPHGKGAVVFEPSLPDTQSIMRPLHMPVSTKTLSATGIHAGSLLKDARPPAKEGCSDFINSHPKEDMTFASEKRSHSWAISAAAHGDGLIPELQARVSAFEPVTRQSLVSYSEGLSSPLMAKSWVNNKRKASEGTDAMALELKSSKDFASFETPKILHEVPVANLHSGPPSGELITAVKQTDSKELKGSTLQQPASEGSYGTTKSDRAEAAEPAPSASTTASFPWEMFVEAAGPSKITREQFVEVYNRARDELKNRKASHVTNRISDKETENGPGLTSKHGTCNHDIPTDMLGRQTSQIQQQPVGCLQVKNISGSLDHIVQFWGVSAKALNAPGTSDKALIAHMSQKETIVRKKHAVSLAEGEVQGLLERKVAAFWTIHGHGADGGEDAALVSGQHDVTLRDYVCPAAASKDRQRTLEKSSEGGVHASQGFASNSAIEQHQVPSKHKDFPYLKGLDKAAGISNDSNDGQDKAPVLLGKRQRGVFDSSATPSALVVGKGRTVHHEGLPIRSHVWLQRWCPNISNIKGVHGMNKPKHRDGCGAFKKATEKKSTITDKEVFAQRIGTEPESECLKMRPTKVLPSAAAMAIVGTAARQFCSAQPQRKGSFAFWSGFRTPTPPKPDAFIGKGKKGFSSEANPSMQS